MKRGYLVLVFLFVLACLPFAMAPPAQANGTMVLNDHATIIAGPAVRGQLDLANGMFAEANNLNNVYMYENDNPKIHRYVEDSSLAKPWTRSLEVSYMLKFGEELAGTKGNTNKIIQ
jgi:hypothetical protein